MCVFTMKNQDLQRENQQKNAELALITAQKFLADINKSIAKLDKSIDEVKAFQEASVVGKIEGWRSYILQASQRLAANPNSGESTVIANHLEQINLQGLELFCSTQSLLLKKIEVLLSSLNGGQAKPDTLREVDQACSQIEKVAGQLMEFSQIRTINALAMAMRMNFGFEVTLSENSKLIESALGSVESRLTEAQEKSTALATRWFDTPEIGNRFKKEIGGRIEKVQLALSSQKAEHLAQLGRAKERLAARQSIIVTIDSAGNVKPLLRAPKRAA
ncbi:MAG: hypothetical protein HC883_06070 [Bdellovibrionaceae bacterium]|nr:hypothetical protein [Pseudobdellovibrionaceae bacterium]